MTYRKLSGLIIFLLSLYALSQLHTYCLAQMPDTLWTRQIYGPYSVTYGKSVIESSDGGYIIAGTSMYDAVSHCMYIAKLSNNGDSLWSSNLGGWEGYSVIELSDGGIIAGGISHNNGIYSAYIVKVNEQQGNTIWQKSVPGADVCYSLSATNNAGFVLTGAKWVSGHARVLLARMDNNGDTVWTRMYGIGEGQYGRSVKQTFDGGYVIAGHASMGLPSGIDIYLIKTDSLGNVQWEQSFGGNDGDHGLSVVQTYDGGFAITGKTQSYGNGNEDIFILKTDLDGNMEWMRTFGTHSNDSGRSIIQTSDGGLIAAGNMRTYPTMRDDIFLIKTNTNGDSLWALFIGDSLSSEHAYSINHTSDDGFIVAGSKGGAFYVVKLTAEPTGNYSDDLLYPLRDKLINNHPNPFNVATSISYSLPVESEISLSVYNILGQRVETLFEGVQEAGEHDITWDAPHLPSGIYFARLEIAGQTENVKMVLLK